MHMDKTGRLHGRVPMKKLISIRVSDRTTEQIKSIAAILDTTQAEVIARAMEMYSDHMQRVLEVAENK